jgi:hypothetical protein
MVGREGESGTSLSSASPHLPVAPARAAAANQVGPRLLTLIFGDTAQGLRHSAEWLRVVGAARHDHALHPGQYKSGRLKIPVPHPGGGAPTLWGRTEFSTLDMANESQLVYARLNFLIAETTAALSHSTGSGVLVTGEIAYSTVARVLPAGPSLNVISRSSSDRSACSTPTATALRVGVSFIPVAVATVAGAHTASRLLLRAPAHAAAVIAVFLVPGVVPAVLRDASDGRPAY